MHSMAKSRHLMSKLNIQVQSINFNQYLRLNVLKQFEQFAQTKHLKFDTWLFLQLIINSNVNLLEKFV